MSDLPLAARVVEVIADNGEDETPRYRYGSGCLVAGRTVLTAAHIVLGATKLMIRDPNKVMFEASQNPSFVGGIDGQQPDLALIEINGQAAGVPAMDLAAVDRESPNAEALDCNVIGFPTFMEQTARDGTHIRETALLNGYVPVLSKLVSGLLTVQVASAPRPLPPEHTALGESEWAGMSGAPVIADGYLIGVITEHSPLEGTATLTATPLTALQANPAHLGWGPLVKDGEDPESAVSALVPGPLAGTQAALLEAPMSVPVPVAQPGAWRGLGKARRGERNRPWSAVAGAGVLATGLAQGAWMLRQLAVMVPRLVVTTQPGAWRRGGAQLLLAEAFITAAGKPEPLSSGPACRRCGSGRAGAA